MIVVHSKMISDLREIYHHECLLRLSWKGVERYVGLTKATSAYKSDNCIALYVCDPWLFRNIQLNDYFLLQSTHQLLA